MAAEYYHIQSIGQAWARKTPMQVGEVIKTNGFNPFFSYYENFTHSPMIINQGQPNEEALPRWIVLQAASEGQINFPKVQTAAQLGVNIAGHFLRYARELLFESIREKEFGNLPSRQRCIWVAEGREQLEHWRKRLVSKENTAVHIFKVEVNGNIHTASEEYLPYEEISHTEMIDRARRYWSGHYTVPLKRETFFEGEMKILEQIA